MIDIQQRVLSDIRVELTEEFDRNFERKAFFDRPWAPWSPSYQPGTGSMLSQTGTLRRSIKSRNNAKSITWYTSVKYAYIHNNGGQVEQHFKPSDKMRRWAWAMFHRTKNEKYKRMALAKKINRSFRIPARPFLGYHPCMDKMVEDVAREAVEELAKDTVNNINQAIR